jgi:hypothetical protein
MLARHPNRRRHSSQGLSPSGSLSISTAATLLTLNDVDESVISLISGDNLHTPV